MTLSEQDRAEFVGGYTRALINAWSNEEFAAQLDADPVAALTEVGIAIPEGADVRVDRGGPAADDRQGSLEDQVQMYEDGRMTGRFVFAIPADPKINTGELSDEDLMGVAAGTNFCCCCCTNPCCSCA